MKLPINEVLRDQLIHMRNCDDEMRDAILRRGSLYDGYDEDMEALHIENAQSLKLIIDQHGWPGRTLVGEDGATAAFVIAQNAISLPGTQLFFLERLKVGVAENEANPIHLACLQDRVLFNQGKPCLYGMLFDWDESGELIANVDDVEKVNQRRQELGIRPLAEALDRHKKEIINEGGGPPKNIPEHKRKAAAWAKRVGWQ